MAGILFKAHAETIESMRVSVIAKPTRLTRSRHRLVSRSACCSFPFQIGRQNDPVPLLDLVGDQFGKVGGQSAKSRAAQIGKLRLEFRISDAEVDFLVEYFDDFCRRVPWTANAEPCTCLVSGQGFAQSWHVRQYWRAGLRRYRKGTEIAGPDIFER